MGRYQASQAKMAPGSKYQPTSAALALLIPGSWLLDHGSSTVPARLWCFFHGAVAENQLASIAYYDCILYVERP